MKSGPNYRYKLKGSRPRRKTSHGMFCRVMSSSFLIGSFRSYHAQIESPLPQDTSSFEGNRNTSATGITRAV